MSTSISQFNRLNPYLAKIKERFPLTKEGSSKCTYHVSLDISNSGLSFKVGDSIGIYAQNDPQFVQEVIDALRATGDEMIKDPRNESHSTLKDFLLNKANLTKSNSSFLKFFYEEINEGAKKSRLEFLLQPENKPVLTELLTITDPLDLICEFYQEGMLLDKICSHFSPLLPRFYSVASSPIVHPDEIHLTVSLFSYPHREKTRFGVASHFLCNLAEEKKTPIPLYVQASHAFSLTENHEAPIIMIGPGTGIAPFRGFIQERLARSSQGKNWLFFGERNQNTDFLYREYWEDLSKSKLLRLDTAFSRDQNEKIYVQHRMLERAKELWDWVEKGAVIYICGDAEHMAKEVQGTWLKIFQEQGSMLEEEAKAFFKKLKSEKRYQTDVY